MSEHIWMHLEERDGQSTCEAPGPRTKDPLAVTCPACLAALKLRETSAEGAVMLGILAAGGVRKAVAKVNEAVRNDPVARGLLAGAREVFRAGRELRGRRDPRK
jgi:hypothetical protein